MANQSVTLKQRLTFVLNLALFLIAVRMLAGLAFLFFRLATDLVPTLLREGLPAAFLTIHPRNFIVLAIVLALHGIRALIEGQKSDQEL
jgi:hypothetical protein